jgi:energy-coupling factor transporter ATP-binding protein EcfA2
MVAIQTRSNPFPGLRPFNSDENRLFFGREGQTDELLRRLRLTHFLAVVGTSGSGKSSLVRAGLLPALYSGVMTQAGSTWRIAVMRPGNAPIANLAHVLSQPDVLLAEAEDATVQTLIIEATLQRGALGLVEVVQQARLPDAENLLIVVDQFEELFRFKQRTQPNSSSEEAIAFVKLILEAIRQTELPIYVVLTMRSDFLGDCAQFRGLPEAINDSQYLIPRMTREQQRSAIAGPVAVGGADITPRLVNRLLNDVGDNPDQLPILQHALMRTWDNWVADHASGEPIDLRHYEAIGGMAQALSQHADEIYLALTEPQQRIAEILFKCLTDKGLDGRGIRHPMELKEVCSVAQASETDVVTIIEQFRASGRTFLMPPEEVELYSESILDISHESLMRVWQRLNQWVEDEAESARIYLRLSESANLYNQSKIELLRDPELSYITAWRDHKKPNEAWAQRYNPGFHDAIAFLDQSIAVRFKENQERQENKIKEQIASSSRQTDAFFSYSQQDKLFVEKLYAALTESGRTGWVDWNEIPVGSNWRESIREGMSLASNFILIISPDSIESEVCRYELEYAVACTKRIIPVLYHEVDFQEVHPAIAKLNWIFIRDGDDFNVGFEQFISVLDSDLEYVKTHTKLLAHAHEWEQKDRNDSLLLRGTELEDAEAWLSEASTFKEPRPTGLHVEYIQTSRRFEETKQREIQILAKAARKANQRIFLGSVVLAATLGISTLSGFIAYRSVVAANQAREETEGAILKLQQSQNQAQEAQNQVKAAQERLEAAKRAQLEAETTIEELQRAINQLRQPPVPRDRGRGAATR